MKDVLAVVGSLNVLAVCIVAETNRTRYNRAQGSIDAKVRHHFVG
jgi:hypothetical protein